MPEVHDSPNPSVAEHIRRFEETGGRPRLWRLIVSAGPEYAAYRTRTTREIPVVLLEPVGQRPPRNTAQSTSSLRPST
ncbi:MULTISPECIES: nitroreductase/quinone reductase family protein [unclassified Streptomyces]|uniref:nitroreductase/quinone reductase family protein n=1 Tax=unclassified Streptomyces TaxID=2593676 RepID=UPI0036F9431E